jgi:hypothetical protein
VPLRGSDGARSERRLPTYLSRHFDLFRYVPSPYLPSGHWDCPRGGSQGPSPAALDAVVRCPLAVLPTALLYVADHQDGRRDRHVLLHPGLSINDLRDDRVVGRRRQFHSFPIVRLPDCDVRHQPVPGGEVLRQLRRLLPRPVASRLSCGHDRQRTDGGARNRRPTARRLDGSAATGRRDAGGRHPRRRRRRRGVVGAGMRHGRLQFTRASFVIETQSVDEAIRIDDN